MSLASGTIWEIRNVADYAGAADTNGGGWVPGQSGTDYSFANINSDGSAKYALTNGVTNGTTTIATVSASADMIGNIVYVQGGTGSVAANWYQITGQSTGVSITVDRSTGLTAGTGVTLNIGGALATPGVFSNVSGGIGGQLQSAMKAWMKYSATAYACSNSTAGSNGPCSIPSAITFTVEGYDASRGDRTGNRPTYQWTATLGSLTYAFVLGGGARQIIANVAVDGNSKANAGGISVTVIRTSAAECLVSNCNQSGAIGFLNGVGGCLSCKTVACTTGFSGGGYYAKCSATGGTTGFAAFQSAYKCLAYSMATGFSMTLTNVIASNCTADACTTAGFSASTQVSADSCIASNCTGSGVGFVCGTGYITLHNCAAYNNNANASGTPLFNEGPFASGNTLTSLGADPYVSQATADFRPNANSPGGAQIRAAGIGVYGQTDNCDIGAVQHTDPAGGSSGPLCGYMGMP